MTLSEFFQAFYEVYRCGAKSKACFVECIISAGLVSDEKKEELSRMSRKQKEEIFSGKANPYSFCMRFSDDFGVDNFRDWFGEIGDSDDGCIHDDLMDKFCATFKPYAPEVTSINCFDLIPSLLAKILDEGTKKAIQNSKKVEHGKLLSMYNKQNGRCYLCQRPVTLNRNKSDSMTLYEFEENGSKKAIGLCQSCFKKRTQGREPFPVRENHHFEFSDEIIEKELASALERLEKLGDDELEPSLNYAGLKISKKIDKKEFPLFYRKVSENIAIYYPAMQKLFSDYDGENGSSFQRLAYKMRDLFLQIKGKVNDPVFVFDAIVDEVERKANTSRLVSELIVSFFIQNCEVFDEISE